MTWIYLIPCQQHQLIYLARSAIGHTLVASVATVGADGAGSEHREEDADPDASTPAFREAPPDRPTLWKTPTASL
jgi:hypothetical protein